MGRTPVQRNGAGGLGLATSLRRQFPSPAASLGSRLFAYRALVVGHRVHHALLTRAMPSFLYHVY